ncbi:hypothetical protein CYMTET_43434 [Cymbomonas tetramitiformis]|uniref:Uncharacterized protein n=1 Tax=Cymbomonas tetramitiformis TaxID=36881 RepID=A0AAE0F0J9_9CHLO|nr:hypothetical protein CYMTET_43434 [Cymbomonas tetramitiformis]
MYSAISACAFGVSAPAAPKILAAYVPYCQPATGGGYAVGGATDADGMSPAAPLIGSSDADGASDVSTDELGMQRHTALDAHLPPTRTFADLIGSVGWEFRHDETGAGFNYINTGDTDSIGTGGGSDSDEDAPRSDGGAASGEDASQTPASATHTGRRCRLSGRRLAAASHHRAYDNPPPSL